MGILAEPLAFIRALPLPKGFSVCELGDQWITCETPHRLASAFYKELGCTRYVSIDANGRGTQTFDLNEKWRGKTGCFDLVTDFGTGEHIFNQAQVWRTLHVLCRAGGYIAFDHPAQGYPEHSYYNYHKCLFDDLATANQYEIVRFQSGTTKRGQLWRGVFQKRSNANFQIPQQGRYRGILVI